MTDIKSRPVSADYLANWDRVFGSKRKLVPGPILNWGIEITPPFCILSSECAEAIRSVLERDGREQRELMDRARG